MWRVKRLADPEGVLAPGVVLNEDPGVHLRNLKTTPEIEEVADTCVECGFCEPVCPSRHLTTTPRQRIALRREIARQPSGSPLERALRTEYEYDGIETCAADGACVLACPVGINTGTLIKEFRAAGHGAAAERSALRLARRFRTAERAARAGLRIGGALRRVAGDRPLRAATRGARRVLGSELVPEWVAGMPSAAPRGPPTLGPRRPGRHLLPRLYQQESLGARPGRSGRGRARRPPRGLRAGRVAASDPARRRRALLRNPMGVQGVHGRPCWMANHTIESLWRWSDSGRLPIVVDASSCTHGLAVETAPALSEANRERHSALEFVDAVAWATDHLLPSLEPPPAKLRSAAIHPTCSSRHLGIDRRLATLAGALAEEVFVPPSAGRCGFAGGIAASFTPS